ncbi:APC family permease [Amycolatopsis sp. OK19-0408]|uniref:APC family permease n=1 Tax=Amycolatopsis iheyensis TaxID=2945988 RepID=A0A9X2N6H6_9PSEU|nr:APC family permease [Amycolatopsis iheyensis]MCR6482864.1 APC family permease [Amycolatopsis iheyensis]
MSIQAEPRDGLRRTIGFYGLTFVSLGSIIGSGWLLGALKAAQVAGPASLISWVLAAGMLTLLALVHAELGAAYPVAGGTARFPAFAFGALTGFTAGWMGWIQAVASAPIEVEASLTYLDNIDWVKRHLDLLHADGTLTASGFGWATFLMAVFTVLNVAGVRLVSESNTFVVLLKTAVPLLTIAVLLPLSFRLSNFTAGGGFAPYGAHGVFAALPVGVVFALLGFEQAIQVGGEARHPRRDIARAVITAMLVGAILYTLLEITFIGSVAPANLATGWSDPIHEGAFGPYATLAVLAGAGWLVYVLYTDAVISPAGTGLVYTATSARLAYALGRNDMLPRQLGKLNRAGVPLWAVGLSFLVGEAAFLPFPSWQSLVNVMTSATAIMYAFAPVALMALRNRDPGRPRPYALPMPGLTARIAFVSANLIIYWSGCDVIAKLLLVITVGLPLFLLTRARTPQARRPALDVRAALWIPPWLLGLTAIGYLGRYGEGATNLLPEWLDLAVVVAFSLAVFTVATRLARPAKEVQAAVLTETAA